MSADIVKIDVLHDRAAPVGEIQKIHARRVGVDGGFNGHARHRFLAGKKQIEIACAPTRSFLNDLRDRNAELLPRVLLFERRVSDQLTDLIGAEGFSDFVDREANDARRERGIIAADVRGCKLDRVGCAIQVEPRAGGGVGLMVEDAEERYRLRTREPIVNDEIVGRSAGRNVVYRDCAAEGIDCRDVGRHARLRNFHRVAEENRRHLRDVVGGSRTAAKIAAVEIGEAGFASRTDLKRKPHVARADAFHVTSLLNHGEKNVVAFVEERKFVPHLFELQRDCLRILHLWHGP